MKMQTRLSFLRVLPFIMFCMLLCVEAGCEPQQKHAGLPEKVILAYSTSLNAFLVYITFAKNYFIEEGLDVTPQPYAFGKPALQAVIDEKADIATAGDTPIMFAVMGNKKISILSTIQTATKNEAIVARKDRGITKPSDLKGKKIGVTLGTTGDFFADVFLTTYGIDRKQVTIIDLVPDKMSSALSKGIVDAVSVWNPVLTQVQKNLGNDGIMFYGELFYTEIFCLTAGQNFVKQHPETIKKVLRALVRAETFAKQHPEESRRLVAEYLRIDKTLIDDIWNVFTLRIALDQSLVVSLEEQTRWAISNRLTLRRDMPNYLDFIYVDGLREVKTDALTIFH